MEKTNSVIGAKLRKARISRGMTLEQLSAATGGEFSVPALVGYELGKRNVSAAKLHALAETLGCDVTRLYPTSDPALHDSQTVAHVVTGPPKLIEAFRAVIAVHAAALGLDIASTEDAAPAKPVRKPKAKR